MVDALLHVIRTTVFREELRRTFRPGRWSCTYFHRWHADGPRTAATPALCVAAAASSARSGRLSQDSRFVPGAATVRATSPGCEAGSRVNDCKVVPGG